MRVRASALNPADQKVLSGEFKQSPVAGDTLVLNIDKNIQFIVEQELVNAVQENAAIGGAAIITIQR